MSPRRPAGPSGRSERGVLLPLLALALAGGAAWFVAAQAGPGTPAPGDRTGARAPLLEARRALVAHAAAYPETYGPLGAGPGHLVCPDTDTPLGVWTSGSASRPVADFAGDGPNPPCGGAPLAVGRLPRHVSLGASRRAFHHEPGQRLVYGVSTGYVNNPSGAAVHRAPDVRASRDDVVAVIVDPGGAALPGPTLAGARDPHELLALVRAAISRESGAAAARALPHAFVTRGDLLDAAERRVAAWFVATATRAARRRAGTSLARASAHDLATGPVDRSADGLAEGSVDGFVTWPEPTCSRRRRDRVPALGRRRVGRGLRRARRDDREHAARAPLVRARGVGCRPRGAPPPGLPRRAKASCRLAVARGPRRPTRRHAGSAPAVRGDDRRRAGADGRAGRARHVRSTRREAWSSVSVASRPGATARGGARRRADGVHRSSRARDRARRPRHARAARAARAPRRAPRAPPPRREPRSPRGGASRASSGTSSRAACCPVRCRAMTPSTPVSVEEGTSSRPCRRGSGHVPAAVLGVAGPLDVNGALLDGWGRPLRYERHPGQR